MISLTKYRGALAPGRFKSPPTSLRSACAEGVWPARHGDHERESHKACAKKDLTRGPEVYGANDERYLSMRAEVEAPFRTARIFLLGFSIVSASVATLVATSQLIGALAHGPAARTVEEALPTWGIDVGCVIVLALLFRRDWTARSKQMLRMGREEKLASCKLELASGKSLQLGRLRSFCRPVIVCGTLEQVKAAREAALPYKDELVKRGVFMICIPTDGSTDELPPLDKSDPSAQKWEGRAIRLENWLNWFEEQGGLANAKTEKGLYIGLRLDGRVRASGTGMPPWQVFSLQLAPLEGVWKGFMDGMDGRVGEQ